MHCHASLLWQSMIKEIKEKMNNSTKPKRRETYKLTGFKKAMIFQNLTFFSLKNLPTSKLIINARTNLIH